MMTRGARSAGAIAASEAVCALALMVALVAPQPVEAQTDLGVLRARAGAPDTIPFTIRGGKIHVRGSINASRPLDLMFDTGATITCIRPSALAKGVKVAVDDSSLNRGFGGATTQRVSSENRLDVADLSWEHQPILCFDSQGNDPADGILGYNVFKDKAVEIDYDHGIMIIHDSMPAGVEGYAKFTMRFDDGLPSVETTFNTGHNTDRGWFIIDTGATAALQLRQDFARTHGLYGTMARIGTSTSHGMGRASVRNDVVLLPELTFGSFVLHRVPTHLEQPSAESSVSSGCLLGMDVLKRFNTFLDYAHSDLYLRPNSHFNDPFKASSGPPRWALVAIASIAMAVLAGLVFLSTKWRRRAA